MCNPADVSMPVAELEVWHHGDNLEQETLAIRVIKTGSLTKDRIDKVFTGVGAPQWI